MTTKQILRNELSRKVEGNREFVEYEYYAIADFLTAEEIQTICDVHGEDCESAYDHGVAFDYTDDLTWIDCDKFLCWAEDYLNDYKNDDSQGIEYDIIKRISEKMEKYCAFDIWF